MSARRIAEEANGTTETKKEHKTERQSNVRDSCGREEMHTAYPSMTDAGNGGRGSSARSSVASTRPFTCEKGNSTMLGRGTAREPV
jgi:hypothetical protein